MRLTSPVRVPGVPLRDPVRAAGGVLRTPVRVAGAVLQTPVRVASTVLPGPTRLAGSLLPLGLTPAEQDAPRRSPAMPPAGDGPPLGLGPGSLVWRLFAESYQALTAGSIGLLQTMHPGIGQSLQDHSNFFEDPLDRIFRSLPHIMRVVYADPFAPPGPTAKGELVRSFHGSIKGTDDEGRDYDALDGETFFWAHMTFVYGIVAGSDRLGVPLTEEERDQLFAEALLWYRRYGASEDGMPETRAELEAWWAHMCRDVLELNATSQGILDAAKDGVPCPVPGLPEPVWELVQRPLLTAWLWVGVGLLPEDCRDTLGVAWTDRDERRLAYLRTAIRSFNGLLPPFVRYHPLAYAAMREIAREQRVSFRRAVDGPV
ncbi:oxygenase MpaB family protein [Patulibacter sp.]|uniref:oxygenase MpaB family protein n=1 Tax=Patulibacter sp. TaxID=1912859 RepID=UPI0027212584|nr:oxygenase MpaB family protein [Patulibacter sp.]MDO9409584.1 oxygenase MpaB family protein [Patulibacter sp.]